ncbi:hypothetical protein HK098_007309 [Nowakowskiella sp. JEL0407]|nr:hypothetical protein HK098_007309 [Nowakowskiella sp. JEL0407]
MKYTRKNSNFCLLGQGNVSAHWNLQKEFLLETGLFTVLMFDNKGSGLSDCPEGRYTLVQITIRLIEDVIFESFLCRTSGMAQETIELLDHLNWKRFHVLGTSMGGMIALELAHAVPHRVLSLTLKSTIAHFNGIPLVFIRHLFGEKQTTPIEHSRAKAPLLFSKEWLAQESPYTNFETNFDHAVWFQTKSIEKVGLQTPTGATGQRSAVITHHVGPKRLAEIRNAGFPILVITGNNDSILHQPSSSEYLAQALGARYEVLDNAGHILRLETVEWFNHIFLDHLLNAIQR